jgi:hypothetical protein
MKHTILDWLLSEMPLMNCKKCSVFFFKFVVKLLGNFFVVLMEVFTNAFFYINNGYFSSSSNSKKIPAARW